MLTDYLEAFANPVDLREAQEKYPEEWKKYEEIKRQIIKLMGEADQLAERLRLQVVRSSP